MDISRFRVDAVRAAKKTPTTFPLQTTATKAPASTDRTQSEATFAQRTAELVELQNMLFAQAAHKVLIVLQATDTGGKDGTIRNVFGPVNPQGVNVASFKVPTEPELAHDFLWRVHSHTPRTGEIVVFNRSHYEDVLVVRVHNYVPEERWSKRYDHIVNFEKMLADEGTTIIKLFLHISKGEQAKRLQSRLDDPTKNWKFNAGDLDERQHWDGYQVAFGDMLARTSTDVAPWYVIPSDNKWYRNLVVASIIVETMNGLGLAYPPPTEDFSSVVIT